MKLFAKNGLAITRLEEWISHKQSGAGPRQAAEDKARKEIPMFMCLEIKKLIINMMKFIYLHLVGLDG